MLLVCPNCGTSYQVESATLGATGRAVRCVRCRSTWFAANTEAMAAIARAHRSDITALGASVADSSPEGPAAEPEPTAAEPAPSIDPDITQPVGPGVAPPQETLSATPEPDLPSPPTSPESSPPPQAIVEAPPLAPIEHARQAGSGSLPTPPVDIESIAARRGGRHWPRRRISGPKILGLPTIILALLAANTGLIGWRNELVRLLPQTASLYATIGLPVNLRGLAFEDVVTRKESQDGAEFLVVEGFIRNETRTTAPVPRLRFAVRNSQGREIYAWTAMPARSAIPPGTALPFRSRLASPPPDTRQVLVRFFNRSDLVAGLK